MRIAILNYADVANFGDVLFPFIAEHELRSRLPDAEIGFFSATDFALGEFRSGRYDRERLSAYDAILMCGGEIVHREDSMLRGIYDRLGQDSMMRPTDLVFDWVDLPVAFKAWVGVGMPRPSERVSQDVKRAAASLDLVVARGEGTRGRLLAGGAPPERLEVSPDLGWLIARVVAARGQGQRAMVGSKPYVAVHAMPQLECPGYLEAAAVSLRRIQQRFGVRILCLPLTTCWGDESTLARLHGLSEGAFELVDYRLDVFAKADILAGSAFYLGQSMHGFVGAMAAGRPGGLIYPDLDDKFRELLGFLDAPEWRIDDWRSLDTLVDRLADVTVGAVLGRQAKAVRGVDEMFDRLARRLTAAVMAPVR